MRRTACSAILAAGILAAACSAQASSDDAWADLRAQLTEACTGLAQAAAPGARIALHPNEFGTEGHALALVVTRRPDLPPELALCLHDKRTGATELSAPFDAPPDGLLSTDGNP